MPERLSRLPSHMTLALCALLHAFTHAYGTILVPLYLLMRDDLDLPGVNAAALIVTVYGVVYCLGAFGAGILADRFNRKRLLGIGLIGNAAAILLMGFTHRYELLLVLGVMGGVFGALFHPVAMALVPAHYPKSPGMAIGLLGMGAGLGFFAGPQIAGWRAQAGQWSVLGVSDWQRPLVEMGVLGIVCGILFLLLAREAVKSTRPAGVHRPMGRRLRRRVLAVAAVLGCRDFAGLAGISLVAIFLQVAHGMSVKEAGFIVGTMMLVGVVANPLAVWLTPGRRRLPGLVVILMLGAAGIAAIPHIPVGWILPMLIVFYAFQLGSYSVSDSAILERVSPLVRGRVVGLFLTLAGTFASTGPWVMGGWTDLLGERAADTAAYAWPFGVLGGMMAVAALAAPLIARLGKAPHETVIEPVSEVDPATLEAMG